MIEYLSHQGNDNTVANVARVSMELDGQFDDLPENYTPEQRNKLIKYLAKHKHTSPFRHNSVSIRCNVPIFLARQLVKHQAGLSWNEVSRRYTTDDITFYHPEEWRSAPTEGVKQGSSTVHPENDEIVGWYNSIMEESMERYEGMLECGVAPEMARMILPQSMMVQYIWTGNLMAFAHVYNLRIDGHSQKEAQDFASALDNIIRPLYPVAWDALTSK